MSRTERRDIRRDSRPEAPGATVPASAWLACIEDNTGARPGTRHIGLSEPARPVSAWDADEAQMDQEAVPAFE